MDGGLPQLLDAAGEAAEILRGWVDEDEYIRVVSHLDADGLAAAGVVGRCLHRLSASFRIRIERWLDENVISELASEAPSPIIFADMGSGYLNLIGERLREVPIIVVDHHPPVGSPTPNVFQVNPHLHGIDGARDISGAGVAYLLAREVDGRNRDLAYLAVVGALGDLQDKYGDRSLGGVNELVVRDAVDAGYLRVEKDLLLYGRETRPVHKALAHTTNPYIPGITGEEDRCLALLVKAGVKLKDGERWRTASELTKEERERVFSLLTEHMLSQGLNVDEAFKLVGAVYVLVREEPWTPLRDGREFASLLNACGRMDRAGLGVSICMGDRSSTLKEARETLDEYRRTLMDAMSWVYGEPGRLEELESVYVIHGGGRISERLVGTVTSLVASSLPGARKPVVAYAFIGGDAAKFSMRLGPGAPAVNLGEVARVAAERCSGIGGGHDVAAGAQVPRERVKDFISLVNKLVGEAIGDRGEA